jgi:hypothetical protein
MPQRQVIPCQENNLREGLKLRRDGEITVSNQSSGERFEGEVRGNILLAQLQRYRSSP